MGDSVLDPAASSADAKSPPTTSSPTEASYAFLVHSQETLPNNLPPDVDNKPLARQKRRRTRYDNAFPQYRLQPDASIYNAGKQLKYMQLLQIADHSTSHSPEDQATLEAEFLRNSKPDKAARMEIVEKVALGEKEVQIWFQNRRQNSRRKSRPLLPHEIPGLRSSFVDASFETGPSQPSSSESQEEGGSGPSQGGQPPTHTDPSLATTLSAPGSLEDALQMDRNMPPSSSSPTTAQTSQDITAGRMSFETAITATQQPSSSQGADQISSSQPGYLANRRSALARQNSNTALDTLVAGGVPTNTGREPRTLKKTPSSVRLSMTSDGAAKVILNDESSPSPPRSQPILMAPVERSGELRRSHSAVGLNDKFRQAQSDPSTRALRRAGSGRSRDSRAWEFWCDKDARSALEEKAHQEQSGSAADAIGLIRSNSGRGVLAPNPSKRNSHLTRNAANRLRTGTDELLSRSTPGAGRLQSKTTSIAKALVKSASPKKRKRAGSAEEDVEVSNNESDKENWIPGKQNVQRRRILPPAQPDKRGRQVLGENHQIPSQSSSLGTLMRREKLRKSPLKNQGLRDESDENVNPENDDEIATFMGKTRRSDSESTSFSGVEDLDCVQGLLSLSQGDWKR
ncbi:Homeobox protein yox1 [Cryomyces antarcticus]|uniref:Homeobox protein yox1 n=1 Tax=Cryomyces antarcticus TaxID=329879 RepID=A0ABR0M792_9PEZI|nr:Homeobox protein yox1 [Cryomyces antarcticus]